MRHLAKKGVMSAVTIAGRERRENGLIVTKLRVDDGYHFKRYALERRVSRTLAAGMERFLRRRPDMPFEHRKNRTRRLLYKLPAFQEWSAFMPGALALEPIHDPDQKRLVSGGRIDLVTRGLFRHAADPIGIRTRTVTGAWLVHQNLPKTRKTVEWLSLAGGTGITSLLMLEASGIPKDSWRISVVDLDRQALEIFMEYSAARGIPKNHTKGVYMDVLSPEVGKSFTPGSFDVVELMGIFEYFDQADSVLLLKRAYAMAKPGGLVVFGNMRRKHPQLHLHKRGVGWPGVMPRSVQQVSEIIQAADISLDSLSVYQPTDGVYNVYQIVKAENER